MYGRLVGFLIDVKADRIAPTFHGQVGLAVASQAIFVGEAVRIKYITNFVRCVAVNTGRDLARVLRPQIALDDLAMYVFNLAVTRGASLTNIVGMNA